MNTIRELFKTLALLVVAIFLIGIAYAWTEPTVSPPNPNPGTSSPLNTSSIAQTKAGNLVINALGISNTANNALTVTGGGIFGGGIKVGNDPASCSSTYAGSIRYNSTISNMEICNGSEWKGLYTVTTSNSSGTGSFTCNADKCVATCANTDVTLARNQTKFCTTTGTATRNVWGTSGGYLNASVNKKNSGWVDTPVNYSVTCDFFERASYVYMLNCRDNYGAAIPWSTSLYNLTIDWDGTRYCTASYRNYTGGTAHAEADFSNINCTSSGNRTADVYPNSSCSGATTRIQCLEATDTNNTKYQVRNGVVLNFGSFPSNWSSIDTNF